ncbi:MAG: hypothetical protein H6730_16325 [Deltaproteobacteria bacterium]|nr:hypothetical protein [Deltaproteobacteria bacterium]
MHASRAWAAWSAALLAGLAVAACGGDKRASTYRRTEGCALGSFLNCQCADGTSGLSTCDGQKFSACVCGDGDAGTSDSGLLEQDSGIPDFDSGLPGADSGFPGADSGFPGADSGFPTNDAGFPTNDAGFPDSGPRPDAGFPDSGPRPDAGFPDSGPRPDAGFPDSGPAGPCTDDVACGAPLAVCEAGQCIPGCGQPDPNALVCADPNDCSPLTGRCDGFGLCFADTDCNPPASVCELILVVAGICVPGCAEPGATACGTGTSCNASTGHCQ